MTALARSSGLLHRSTASGVGRVDSLPPVDFTATGWTTPDLVGVTAVGELDVATASMLTTEVDNICRAGAAAEVREFLLDLRGVTFLDSTGLRAADRAKQSATNWGWRVSVTQPIARGPRQLMILALRYGRDSR